MDREELHTLLWLKNRLGLPTHWRKKDVNEHFGYPRSLPTREIFRRQRFVYISKDLVRSVRRIRIPIFIKGINSDVIETIHSISIFNSEVLLSEGNPDIVLDYIRSQYLIKYNNSYYTASFTEDFPDFHRGFDENPHNLMKIRQEMRSIGLYNCRILTLNEICGWYFIDPSSEYVKRQICDILGIAYVPSNIRSYIEIQPCRFRNLSTDEIASFESLRAAGRYFKMSHGSVKIRIDRELTIYVRDTPYRAI